MRVLVLGGSGFLGTALINTLVRRGYKEITSTYFTRPYSGNDMVQNLHANLTDEHIVDEVYRVTSPDIVINLAAFVGGIGLNQENPGRMFYDNIRIGTFCTHYAHIHNVKKYVYIGTVCSYPKFTPVPFQEEKMWDGFPEETNAPYGVVKKSIGLMLQSYGQQYGLNGMFLIPVNMYGPNDDFDERSSHVIPALIKKMIEAKRENQNVRLWGDGSATREFLYVDDCAEAIVLAVEKHCGPQPINIGSGNEISIKDLAIKIAGLVGFTGDIEWDTSKPNGQPRRCLDTSKALDCFGFKASTSLEEGLKATIDWYQKNGE